MAKYLLAYKGGSGLSGYSILEADSFAAAAELSKGCPIFAAGGSIDVYEALAIM
jgi:hypothetical protein